MSKQPLLLKEEQNASAFVLHIGIERAERILNAICKRFDRRYERACDNSMSPINREWVYRTEFEVSLTHKIKIGLTLVDQYNTPAAAKKRILERIENRKRKLSKLH